MLDRPRTSLGILAILLFLPQSIYVIGDYLAIGIRFPFFKVQLVLQAVNGTGNTTAVNTIAQPITIFREIQYITAGMVGNILGRTAVATYIWVAGLVILLLAAVLVFSWQVHDHDEHARYPGPLVIVSGGLFLLWGMVQYGPFLFGPDGYSIPIGVPLFWFIGYQFIRAAQAEEE